MIDEQIKKMEKMIEIFPDDDPLRKGLTEILGLLKFIKASDAELGRKAVAFQMKKPNMSDAVLSEIAEAAGVRLGWLKTGEGSMYEKPRLALVPSGEPKK